MPYSYLDPRLIACPSPDSKLSIEEYAESLTRWFDFHQENWCTIFRLKELAFFLFEEDLYPMEQPIKNLLAQSDSVFQLNDLIKLTNFFLQQTPVLEEDLGIEDLDFDVEYDSNTDKFLSKAVQRLIALSVLKKNFTGFEYSSIALGNIDDSLNYECSINAILYSDSTFSEDEIDEVGELLSVSSKESLCKNIDPEFFLNRLTNRLKLKGAIQVEAIKMASQNGLQIDFSESYFCLGDDFFNTLQRHHFDTDITKLRMLLRATSETILKLKLDETHHLREGSGPNDDQIKINDWCAWRKDIDHEFHLHYWLRGEYICFSDIVPHKEMSITDPPA